MTSLLLPHTPADSRPTRIRFLVLSLVAFAAASAYLTRYCLSAANTTIRSELSLDNEQMGRVFEAFSWGYLLFQIPGGWVGQRFGTRGAFALSSVTWSLLTVWTAFARSYDDLVISRFLFGLAQAGLAPLAGQVLKDWAPASRRGMNSAVVSGSMSVGGSITLYLTGLLLERTTVSWRVIFIGWSMVGILWAIAFYILFRTRPEQHPWVNEAERDLIRGEPVDRAHTEAAQRTAAVEPPRDAHDPPLPERRSLWLSMLMSVGLWALCAQSFFRAAAYEFFANWFFAFLEYAYAIPKDRAGWLSNLPLYAIVAGSLAGGVLVDWVHRWTGSRWWSRSGVAAGSLGICALLTWAAGGAGSALQLTVILAAGAFCSGIAAPAIWAATIDVGGSQTGVTLGVMNMAGCLSGAVIPSVIGRMIDRISATQGDWNQIILIHVAFFAAAAVSCLFIRPSRPVA